MTMATTLEPARATPGAAAGRRQPDEVSGRRCWPLGRTALGVLVAGYVALTAIWTAIGLLIVNVVADTWLGERETALSTWLEEHRTPALDEWSHWGSMASDTFTKLIAVPLLCAVFVVAWKRWHDAVFLATVMLFEVSVFATTAYLVGRDRPPVEQLDGSLPTNSFPSGHVAAAVAFYVGLFVIARWHTKRKAILVPAGVLAVLIPLNVIVSRLYRGMHYLSDVLAGVALGAATLAVTYLALRVGMRWMESRHADPLPAHVTTLDLTEERS
jgi:undecaprenyl-diphosphatase